MKLESLNTLSDAELQSVIAHSQELLKIRDGERKAKALSDARALLASVGLSLKDINNGKGNAKATKALPYRAGQIYQHPTDKALTWNAKGQKPGWLRELEGQGKRAVELLAELSKNDDAAPLRKAG